MKVLMFGWEFPPFNKGGLGTACHGLTKGLNHHGVDVTFVLPKAAKGTKGESTHVELLLANDYYVDNERLRFKTINSLLAPYISSEEYGYNYADLRKKKIKEGSMDEEDDVYGSNLFEEVQRYSDKAKLIGALEDFDIIHAHDWMTYKAGVEARKASGKPLVIHVHATEYDRTGGNPNEFVYNLEREGMHEADRIMAVSNFTKNKIVQHYGVPPEKIDVVHNAVAFNNNKFDKSSLALSGTGKMVLFLGRITLQKGPDYFIDAAKKVLDHLDEEEKDDVKFVFAGSGDMESKMIERAAELGLSKNILFAGWVRGKELDRLYAMADLYVMPSVSEPFGITPLEAMRNNTPCLISKQSGVSEVVNHCLKVDFWDIDETADKIMGVLKYSSLQKTLKVNGSVEVKKFDWNDPAKKCLGVYNNVLGNYVPQRNLPY